MAASVFFLRFPPITATEIRWHQHHPLVDVMLVQIFWHHADPQRIDRPALRTATPPPAPSRAAGAGRWQRLLVGCVELSLTAELRAQHAQAQARLSRGPQR
jgi:hypothetical protein